jgi:hypothetical protein
MKQNTQIDIPIDSLTRMLKIINNELRLNLINENFDYNLYTLLYLITIIARIIFNSNKAEQQEIPMNKRQELFQLIQLIIRYEYRTIKDGSFLLHLCSSSSTISISDEIR